MGKSSLAQVLIAQAAVDQRANVSIDGFHYSEANFTIINMTGE